jgi:hypothetical protein
MAATEEKIGHRDLHQKTPRCTVFATCTGFGIS